jgi:hypothetical protein
VSNVSEASIGFPFLKLVFFTCAVELDPVVVVAKLEVLGVTVTSVEGLGILRSALEKTR